MTKIYFHIGQPKTGTTRIQGLFKKNKSELLAQGFLYPDPVIRGNNHAILTVPVTGFVQRSLVPKIGSDFDAAVTTSHEAWARVADEIAEAKPDAVIISSEFFFRAPFLKIFARIIQDYLGPEAQINFIAYLRAPSRFYASAIQQNLKASHVLPLPQVQPMLKKLTRLSKLGQVTARKFAVEDLRGGDVVKDICKVLGVEYDQLKAVPTEPNTSISAEGAAILQEYRREHHPDKKNVFTDDTKAFLARIMAEEAANPGVYSGVRLKPEVAQFLDQETPELRELEARFGVRLSQDHGVPPLSEEQIEGLQDLTEVIQYDPERLERMRRALFS